MSSGFQAQTKPQVSFDWISESWQIVNANAVIWVGATFITFFVSSMVSSGMNSLLHVYAAIASSMLSHGLDPHQFIQVNSDPVGSAFAKYTNPAYAFAVLVQTAVQSYLWSGMLQMANASVRGEQIDINMLFKGWATYPAVFLVNLVISFGYMGMLIYVIPGLIIYALILPALALAADGESIPATFAKSAKAMAPNLIMGSLFVLYGCIVGLIGIVLTCGIGSLAVFPMALVCSSLAYRDMIGMPDSAHYDDPVFGGNSHRTSGAWPPAPSLNQWQPDSPQNQPTNPYSRPMSNPNPYRQIPPSAPPSQPTQTSAPYPPYLSANQPTKPESDDTKADPKPQVPPRFPGDENETQD